MGNAFFAVGDAGVEPHKGQAAPVQADQDFIVKIHAVAHLFVMHHVQKRGNRIDAEAAHAVFDVARAGVYRVPKIGDFAAVKPRFGHAAIVHRPAANHRLRLRARGFDKARDVGKIVLGVGVDLQHMTVALFGGQFHPPFHRAALAAVNRSESSLNALATHRFHRCAVFFARAVIHHQHRQAGSTQGGDHLRQGGRMAVVGNQGNDVHGQQTKKAA